MKWTKGKPTKPGWYWSRRVDDTDSQPVLQRLGYELGGCCEWAGPVEPPAGWQHEIGEPEKQPSHVNKSQREIIAYMVDEEYHWFRIADADCWRVSKHGTDYSLYCSGGKWVMGIDSPGFGDLMDQQAAFKWLLVHGFDPPERLSP